MANIQGQTDDMITGIYGLHPLNKNDVKSQIGRICAEIGANAFVSACRYNYEMMDEIVNIYDDNDKLLITMSEDDYIDEIWLDMPEFKKFQ